MFRLSSAASLNLGWSENGVLGNGLNLPNDNFKLLQTEVLTDKRLKFDDNDRKSKKTLWEKEKLEPSLNVT